MLTVLMTLAAEVPTVPASPATAMDFTWLFVKMLLLLAIVCIVAILLLKFGAPRLPIFRKMASSGFAKILARQSIDQRKHLYLVRIGKRYLVIGSADHAINLLAELSPEDAKGLDIPGVEENP